MVKSRNLKTSQFVCPIYTDLIKVTWLVQKLKQRIWVVGKGMKLAQEGCDNNRDNKTNSTTLSKNGDT